MKTATANAIVQIEESLKAFKPVDETLATQHFQSTIKRKSFGAIDLWNCRKQRRFTGIRVK